MTTHDDDPTTESKPTPIAQATLFDDEPLFDVDLPGDDPALLDYEEQPILLVDTDPERALARQKELMDACFGGIGEETKMEKRLGLAMQQLDIEQRHALRLLLIYQDAGQLAAHLQRCLDEPTYGYGERGDIGRTLAQAMSALTENDLIEIVGEWLAMHHDFQQRVLSGVPLSFRSMFDYADLDSFVPLLQRIGDMNWRLGLEGEGKYRDFQGPMEKIWPEICDTYVQWSDADNDAWLAETKQQAARLPDSISRAARADRLRKEKDRIEVKGTQITLITERQAEEWPRMVTLVDSEGNGMLGLSRLSGHSFYELAWEGGLHVRRFELSSTTRQKVPFEHIELATLLAEAIGATYGLQPQPVTAAEVEAAYLRRMKAATAEIGPAQLTELPSAIQGKPVASYQVNHIVATMLQGGEDFAYITSGTSDQAILLRRDSLRGVITAMPVRRGRPQRSNILMTTPLAEIDLNSSWNRALCAWGAWLAGTLAKG